MRNMIIRMYTIQIVVQERCSYIDFNMLKGCCIYTALQEAFSSLHYNPIMMLRGSAVCLSVFLLEQNPFCLKDLLLLFLPSHA